MAAEYSIERVVSKSRNGAAMVIVNFAGRSVTRHIKNGIGRHPDDTIPALHAKLNERIEENQILTNNKKQAIANLTVTGKKESLDLAAKMQREIQQLELALQVLLSARQQVQKNDPLMVRYI